MKNTRCLLLVLIMLWHVTFQTAAQASTPESTEEPDGETIELPQTFRIGTVLDGYYTVNYPEGWAFDSSGGLVFSSDEALLTDASQLPGPGQLKGNIIYFSEDMLTAAPLPGLTINSSVRDVLDVLIASLNNDFTQALIDEDHINVYEGDRPIVTAFGSTGSRDIVLAVVGDDTGFGVFIVLAGGGEGAHYVSTIRAMAESLVYTPPVEAVLPPIGDDAILRLGSTIRSTMFEHNREVVLRYPTRWVARNLVDGLIIFATDQQTLDTVSTIPPAGRALGQLMVLPEDELYFLFEIEESLVTPVEILDTILDPTNSETIMLTPTESFTAHGQEAAIATARYADGTISGDVIYVLIAEEDGYTVITINTPVGEAFLYEDLARAIADKLEIHEKE